jgi:hypothetical protein
MKLLQMPSESRYICKLKITPLAVIAGIVSIRLYIWVSGILRRIPCLDFMPIHQMTSKICKITVQSRAISTVEVREFKIIQVLNVGNRADHMLALTMMKLQLLSVQILVWRVHITEYTIAYTDKTTLYTVTSFSLLTDRW